MAPGVLVTAPVLYSAIDFVKKVADKKNRDMIFVSDYFWYLCFQTGNWLYVLWDMKGERRLGKLS